jgi:ABC-type polysaccharide/polyol phosphate transport system ATPase subunit
LFTGYNAAENPDVAKIELKNVVAEFPIYGSQLNLRNVLLGRVAGGVLRRQNDAGKRVVVRALEDVSLTVNHGDQLGIIGHNGAGKSTMLRVCAGIYQPSQGTIGIEGRISPLFSTSPGLDLDDTGYENIVTCGLLLGMSRGEIERKLPEIEAFSELSDYLALPARTYSTGMLVRLGFAIATAIDPEILLLDEELGTGDTRFAQRAAKRVKALIERSSIMVFASHSVELIHQMCNRAILLDRGKIVVDGPVKDVLEIYSRMNKDEPPGVAARAGAEEQAGQVTPIAARAM